MRVPPRLDDDLRRVITTRGDISLKAVSLGDTHGDPLGRW